MSVKFVSAILGPEMAARLEKMRSFCRKPMFIEFLVLGGGYFGFGGGECRFYFYGRGDFSDKGRKNNKLYFFVAETGPFGTPPFDPPKSLPKKFMWFPFFASLTFFLGAQHGMFWVGPKKFMLKKFMCFFGPLQVGALSCDHLKTAKMCQEFWLYRFWRVLQVILLQIYSGHFFLATTQKTLSPLIKEIDVFLLN